MFLSRKKRIRKELEESFGNVKSQAFNFNLISRYFVNKSQVDKMQIVSDQVCDDLDFDLLFKFLDRTNSKVGQQYLYNRLRTIHFNQEQVVEQEDLINFLKQHPAIRNEIQYELTKLDHFQSYYIVDLFQQKLEEKSKFFFLIPLLSFTTVLSLILSFFNSQLFLVFLFALPINVIVHYGLKRKVNVFLNSVPALLQLGYVANKISKLGLSQRTGKETEDAIRVISGIRRKMSFFKLEQKVDSDMEAAYWFLLEAVKITFLLEPLLLFSAIDNIKSNRSQIEEVFCFVGNIDTLISILALRSKVKTTIPEIDTKLEYMMGDGIIHPLVPNCVPNSLMSLNSSILLTGSNMSGKTTFIRALGINYLTGITLNTCFADSMKIPVAKLFTLIRVSDDVSNSSSYFFKEMDEMKKIIDECHGSIPSIILLDELFKGTNTKERIAAAKGILSYLRSFKNQVFVATHDIELTEMLKDEYDLYHFSESIENNEITFDYKLKLGVPKTGNAIQILAVNGFPDEIISEAKSLVQS